MNNIKVDHNDIECEGVEGIRVAWNRDWLLWTFMNIWVAYKVKNFLVRQVTASSEEALCCV
jgi:hypothetical protein